MSYKKPDWDLLIIGQGEDESYYLPFPAKIRHNKDYLALEGMRFRNVYVTNDAIATGNAALFSILYRTAIITGGKVLHYNDWEPGA